VRTGTALEIGIGAGCGCDGSKGAEGAMNLEMFLSWGEHQRLGKA